VPGDQLPGVGAETEVLRARAGRQATAFLPFGIGGSLGEIKSAWELAMEKVEGLGKLSPEEVRRQKEAKCAPIGQALAKRYLGGLGLWQLEVELDKYQGDDRSLVEAAFVSELVSAIDLEDTGSLQGIMDAVRLVKQDKAAVDSVDGEIRALLGDYQAVESEQRGELEERGRQLLQVLGISGSSIGGINPGAVERVAGGSSPFAQPYREKLEALKQRLVALG